MPARLPEPCHHTDSGALPRIAVPVQYIVHDAPAAYDWQKLLDVLATGALNTSSRSSTHYTIAGRLLV